MLFHTGILAFSGLVAAQGGDSGGSAAPVSSGIGWEAAFQKAKTFVSQLSLDEKVNLITGNTGPCVGNVGPISRLNFRGICLSDGPLGIRQATNVSTFPAGVNVASSWDRNLARSRGVQIGQEFKAKGSHVAYGPVVGPLGKQALGGRNWEGFSVDPYLSGAMVEETVTGMQNAGVQACTKHFIGNEQETNRGDITSSSTAISSNIDDQTLHELYMWPFANAVRAGTSSVMCSYNKLNGTFACQNPTALNNYLKRELGFQGYVVSDYGAQHSSADSANAGMDVGMPGGNFIILAEPSYFRDNLANDVRSSKVPASRINDMCRRFLTPYFQLGQDQTFPFVDSTNGDGSTYLFQNQDVRNSLIGGASNRNVQANHKALIRNLGAQSTILLKNQGGILPLQKPKSIGVFGNDAGKKIGPLQNQFNYYYGTLPVGGGSGTGNLPYVVDPLSAVQQRAQADGTTVSDFQDNFLLASGVVGPGTFLGLNITEPPDVCLVFLKTWEMEQQDRKNLTSDWAGDTVVNKVAAQCPNTVVVTHSGGINTMPWAKNSNVKAILAAHYPGQEIGNAIVDVLYGNVNPSGHLPYTIANQQGDYNTQVVTAASGQDNFPEKLLIDYRYFDATNKQVQYPFGFGLSYTTFALSGVTGSGSGRVPAAPPTAATRPGGNPRLWDTVYTITATIKNTGTRTGAAVPQLYLSLGPNVPAGHPVRQLRGFNKITLNPGQSKTVSFTLLRRDVSYWDTTRQQWIIPAGKMIASVGLHSRDLRQSTTFTLV